MNGLNRFLAFWLASATIAYGGASVAQDKPGGYPVRPIRLIVAASPGAGVSVTRMGAFRTAGSDGLSVVSESLRVADRRGITRRRFRSISITAESRALSSDAHSSPTHAPWGSRRQPAH